MKLWRKGNDGGKDHRKMKEKRKMVQIKEQGRVLRRCLQGLLLLAPNRERIRTGQPVEQRIVKEEGNNKPQGKQAVRRMRLKKESYQRDDLLIPLRKAHHRLLKCYGELVIPLF